MDNPSFARWAKARRVELGMSQAKLAAKLTELVRLRNPGRRPILKQTVCSWEQLPPRPRASRPRVELREDLAVALEIDKDPAMSAEFYRLLSVPEPASEEQPAA